METGIVKEHPKAFISHASDDKERFVLEFAKRLRLDGIDAWLDRWEMLPGDSLVDRIFEEGIKEADCFIIVLSKNSINKPWVREELNAAVVKRISSQTRIIPVVLDGVAVPECLSGTIYEEIQDLSAYDKSYRRITNSIFNVQDKPPLGNIPRYISERAISFYGLEQIDSIILKEICEFSIKNDRTRFITTAEIYNLVKPYEIDLEQCQESIDILNRHRYIIGTKSIDGLIFSFDLAYRSLLSYCDEVIDNFDDRKRKIAVAIAVQNKGNLQIAQELQLPNVVVNSVFAELQAMGMIKYREMLSGDYMVEDISPELRRNLR